MADQNLASVVPTDAGTNSAAPPRPGGSFSGATRLEPPQVTKVEAPGKPGETGRPSQGSDAWREGEEPRKLSKGSGDAPIAPRGSNIDARTSARPGGSYGSRKSVAPQMRHQLVNSSWYHSQYANNLRTFIRGSLLQGVMFIALLLALFMSDTWIIAGVNSNLAIDVILTIVMFMFTFELLTLSMVDAGYLMSFFFFMDIVGTVSMFFDITYLLGGSFGADHTAPKELNSAGGNRNVMLLRATRAAKVGARAGRLSRVVRVLRYLPFLTGTHRPVSQEKGFATAISGQLANLLATRVACLTIVMVMLLPLFDLWSFPQSDYSLRAWAERIEVMLIENRTADVVTELNSVTAFYSDRSYGPFEACVKDCATGLLTGWKPILGSPPRGASIQNVRSGDLLIRFNMHYPTQIEASMGICTVFFIIVIMIFSSLALSSVVTVLAVRPLERMLSTVREIATTVFKLTADVVEEDEDTADIDNSSEMKLLEKVVQKLAVIAALQARNDENLDTENMREEDIGIINMIQGRDVVADQHKNQRRSLALHQRRKAFSSGLRLEDFGMTQESFNSFGFDALGLSKTQRCQLCNYTILRMLENMDAVLTGKDGELTLQRFVAGCEKEYLPNPFHNFAHAADVCHGTWRMMRLIGSDAFLTELESFALMIAAVGHDLGHPGVNNPFLIEVGHTLALQYNDKSPCENMHCAKLYNVIASPENNVFKDLSKEQYKDVRKCIVEGILHTDMISHGAMVKDLQMMYQMNLEVFTEKPVAAEVSTVAPPAVAGTEMPECLGMEIFSESENKVTIINCILHAADVSNPCRAWDVTHSWAQTCLEEFFAQGDQEKMLGIPVQFLNDRDKLNRPNSQIGFIEFMIAPFFAAQIRLFHGMHQYGDHLGANIQTWMERWESEVGPSEEESAKVRGRVDRVQKSLECARERQDM
eukprot:TRINITY_DN102015_c0_g1_i1.p1 TRINITY_DN102015_c0_g1~~TRINITY_DN102015_c0_g1_i1.p1  ORF type:complete len:931 (-),score=177.56 TRINITY_DN102015_c0_g1_i1:206-2998(-)